MLNEKQRKALVEAVEEGPVPYLDGAVSRQTLGRELNAMGYRKLTARPKHHAQDSQAIEEFLKTSPPLSQRLPPVQPEENK